jgi:murein L,D-transpeptidase YafK
MSIGQNGVGKQRAWDRRTPLGLYFVVDQLDTERMPDKYGITAFPLDYPNEWDRLNRRTGDGIWLHGVQKGPDRRPEYDTDGCIALPNDDLAALEERIRPGLTPVVVTRDVDYLEDEDLASLRAGLKSALDAWAASLAARDLHAYLSLYADDFKYRGMDADDWAALKHRRFSSDVDATIELDDIFLLADPEEDNLYLSRFRQTTTEGESTRHVVKRLYWRRTADGSFRIVAEDNG